METEPRTDTRTGWGRVRFAGGRTPALAIAVPAGLILAAGIGALTHLVSNRPGGQALLAAGIVALFSVQPLIGIVWVMVVDRSTLRGAVDDPDESVESTWLNRAMSGAFTDTIALVGIALTIISLADLMNLTQFTVDAMWALSGVLVVAFCSVAVRYLIAKARG